jgi:hypothetical protein
MTDVSNNFIVGIPSLSESCILKGANGDGDGDGDAIYMRNGVKISEEAEKFVQEFLAEFIEKNGEDKVNGIVSEIAHVLEEIYYDGYDGLGGEAEIRDLYVILRSEYNRYIYYKFTMCHICGDRYEDDYEMVESFERDSMNMNFFE